MRTVVLLALPLAEGSAEKIFTQDAIGRVAGAAAHPRHYESFDIQITQELRGIFFVGDEGNKDDASKHVTDPAIECETCDNYCGKSRKFCKEFCRNLTTPAVEPVKPHCCA